MAQSRRERFSWHFQIPEKGGALNFVSSFWSFSGVLRWFDCAVIARNEAPWQSTQPFRRKRRRVDALSRLCRGGLPGQAGREKADARVNDKGIA
jgi:hypothetical protein